MKVVGVGFTCIDYYEKLKRFYPTGNGVDFCANLSKFGVETAIVTVVGSDEYGKIMIDTLNRYNIDTSHIHMQEGNTALMKMDLLNGNDRIHLECIEGVMEDFALTEDDIEFINKYDIIHTDLTGRVIDQLPRFKENGKTVVFDFSIRHNNNNVKDILPYVDYAFFSYKEEDNYIIDFMKSAKNLGPKVIVVTFGEKGSIAYDGENFYREGIVPVEVVNTVGAGDSFIAGFMRGVMENKDIQECLKYGSKLASEIVQIFEPY